MSAVEDFSRPVSAPVESGVHQAWMDDMLNVGSHVVMLPTAYLGDPAMHSITRMSLGSEPAKLSLGDGLAVESAAGKMVGAMAGIWAADALVDATMFRNQHFGVGSVLGDLAAPIGILLAPMGWRYKVPLMIVSHLTGKLADRYHWL